MGLWNPTLHLRTGGPNTGVDPRIIAFNGRIIWSVAIDDSGALFNNSPDAYVSIGPPPQSSGVKEGAVAKRMLTPARFYGARMIFYNQFGKDIEIFLMEDGEDIRSVFYIPANSFAPTTYLFPTSGGRLQGVGIPMDKLKKYEYHFRIVDGSSVSFQLKFTISCDVEFGNGGRDP